MGKIIKIDNPGELVPTQDYFYDGILRKVNEALNQENKKIMIIIKESPSLKRKLVLDGHHRSMIAYGNRDIKERLWAYAPDNQEDTLETLPPDFYENEGMLRKINFAIARRFQDLEGDTWGCPEKISEMKKLLP